MMQIIGKIGKCSGGRFGGPSNALRLLAVKYAAGSELPWVFVTTFWRVFWCVYGSASALANALYMRLSQGFGAVCAVE